MYLHLEIIQNYKRYYNGRLLNYPYDFSQLMLMFNLDLISLILLKVILSVDTSERFFNPIDSIWASSFVKKSAMTTD